MSDLSIVATAENITRQVLSDQPNPTVVGFRFDVSCAVGAVHDHPHMQSTYLESGRFRFTLGDHQKEFGPGESFVVPSGQAHVCICSEPGRLVDCFTPCREDFL